MWLFFALATTLIWGLAELFYKKGALPDEKYAHLKITVTVGIVMGIHAAFSLLTKDIGYDPMNLINYLPVSLCYILSMAFSFFGMRFIEESISDPIENTSGAICTVLAVVILGESIALGSGVAIVLIVIGILGVGILDNTGTTDRKKKLGKKMAIVAFAMPFCYATIDAIGSFLDIYFLEMETSPLINVSEETIEEVANTSYEITFFIVAILLIIFMKIKGVKYELPKQKDKIIAAICETAGQFTYVFAMSGNGAIAAPIISAVCVVSLILSRIFLKEKLTKLQYLFIFMVIAGILILAVIEGD
ncbi:DMT family transporter [Pseudobutyrivibrio sp.]|uniref:DMT family transporter n=1 Tax=Pseudobutyrivibrio sp. TaxID=2014367 RepID=UPI001D964339|nr:DMT family transporter [Pseudobutyrivibrio sp.]MBE5911719.1 DMT family transporter [Pseudobutyrivibrio sp.]